MKVTSRTAVVLTAALTAGCGASDVTTPSAAGNTSSATSTPASGVAPVFVVLFTHIEDTTPPGPLGTSANRTAYLNLRARLLEMGTVARGYNIKWSFEPDWKFLLAAQQYEDATATSSTNGMNVLRYLRDVSGAAVDPHSHEAGGYNYTDVAYLLEALGVGGSTVIGGHIWDPALPQFAEWDRFRVPVRGMRYPQATWRGDILMGSGTPNHTNDPIVSGVWRPKDRHNYFVDDPAGNIACTGAYKGDIDGISELIELYRAGRVAPTCMLTASYHIRPADITAGVPAIESTVLRPLAALRDSGQIVLTDFTTLVATWRQQYGAQACLYDVTPR